MSSPRCFPGKMSRQDSVESFSPGVLSHSGGTDHPAGSGQKSCGGNVPYALWSAAPRISKLVLISLQSPPCRHPESRWAAAGIPSPAQQEACSRAARGTATTKLSETPHCGSTRTLLHFAPLPYLPVPYPYTSPLWPPPASDATTRPQFKFQPGRGGSKTEGACAKCLLKTTIPRRPLEWWRARGTAHVLRRPPQVQAGDREAAFKRWNCDRCSQSGGKRTEEPKRTHNPGRLPQVDQPHYRGCLFFLGGFLSSYPERCFQTIFTLLRHLQLTSWLSHGVGLEEIGK